MATRRIGEVVRPSALVTARERPGSGDDHPERGDTVLETRLPQVPGYDVLDILGHGGMGVVYRARQRSLDRFVALKMIRNAHVSSPAERLRFRAEALAVAQLTHPHIIQIHEIGEHDGVPYISLELVEGGTLDDWLSERPQPALEAAAFVEQVARAVQFAHARGLMHRDLKPSNLLLDWGPHNAERVHLGQATPKIADFGLVKQIDATDGLTRTGEVMGTPSYMAPEQANPSAGATGPWTDVYALGAILYELLTGRPPFEGPTGLDTLRLVLDSEPVAPRRLRRDIPADLETIVLKCLAKDPRQRYLSAEDLADDLARFAAGEPIRGRPIGALTRLGRRMRRNPVVAGLAGVLLLLLAGLGIFALALWHRDAEHHRLGLQTVDKHLADVADLEREALRTRAPEDFDRALQKLELAEEHLQRIREPYLFEQAAAVQQRLLRNRALAQDDQQEKSRDAAFVQVLDSARLDLLGAEEDGRMVVTNGQTLRQALLDNGIPVGKAGPDELVAAVRKRGRIQREIVDAMVECYPGLANEKEVGDFLAAIDALEGDPAARQVLEWLARDPERMLEPANQRLLRKLPASYTLVTSSSLVHRENTDGAVRVLRAGIVVQPENFWLHYSLGHVLQTRQPPAPAAALTAFFAALAVRPSSGHTLTNLGCALMGVGRQEEGLEYLEKACRLHPNFASYHNNLAIALRHVGQLDRARAELRRALEIDPRYPNALVEMAGVELESGKLADAATWLGKAIEAVPREGTMRTTLTLRLQRTQQYQKLEGKLERVLSGQVQPASAIDWADLIELCYFKGKHLDAYRLSKQAFARFPGLEEDRKGSWFRFNAACYAALAAAGQGDGAARLTDADRTAIRGDALAWLQAELAELKRQRDTGTARKRLEVESALREWLTDPALTGVRERGWIERFPAVERKAWLALWAEIDVILERLEQDGR
jgi:serine/threonine-protein kinase